MELTKLSICLCWVPWFIWCWFHAERDIKIYFQSSSCSYPIWTTSFVEDTFFNLFHGPRCQKSGEYRNKGLYVDLSSILVISKSVLCTKLKSEWIKDLNNIKSDAQTLTEEKVRKTLNTLAQETIYWTEHQYHKL